MWVDNSDYLEVILLVEGVTDNIAGDYRLICASACLSEIHALNRAQDFQCRAQMSAAAGGATGAPKRLNLRLKKFDMSRIRHDKVVVLIGRRETGKSFLVKDLLWHHQSLPCGTVISGTEGSNQFYSKIVPPMFIHEEYSPLIIANVLKRQRLLAKKIAKDIGERGTTAVDPRNFLILDDCLFNNSWINDRNVRYLFMNGRHVHTMFIITMQYAMGIPPALRTNIDYVFILRDNYIANRRKLYEQYAGMFPDFDSFCQVMNQCTENYECLVIDNNAKSNRLEDQVFWYKAAPHPDFRLCSPEVWAQSAAFSRSEEDDAEDFDPTAGGSRRKYQLAVHRA